ncbi:hypothetical protein CR513_16981, partial [Mucuna pruriens]
MEERNFLLTNGNEGLNRRVRPVINISTLNTRLILAKTLHSRNLQKRSMRINKEGVYVLGVMSPLHGGGGFIENEMLGNEASENPKENTMMLHISSVVDITSKKSLKLWGTILDKKVIILVDSGASHNFLSCDLADETREYAIEVGDEHRIVNKGGVNVVLGYVWLEELGDIKENFKEHMMKVKAKGEEVELRGDPTLCRTVASIEAIVKEWKKGGDTYYIELRMMTLCYKEMPSDDPNEGVRTLLKEYFELFQEVVQLPPPRSCDHAIVIKERSQIPNIRPYRYPHNHKDAIEKFVHDMMEGLIRPSISSYSSPLILVKKKDGSWRFCTDYRALNNVTIPRAVIFSKLDLKSGYHQIRMKGGDIHKITFQTHEGHYEYLVMPFGLTNAPSTFLALMNDIFRPYLRKFVLVFFDDILIYSTNQQYHLEQLRTILEVFRRNSLKKCSFGVKKLEYLRHIIYVEGIRVDLNKVKAMVDWPLLKDMKGLRSFLGLTGTTEDL